MSKMCDAVVVSVGYRLAPESRFPAAFEDCLAVLNWLGKQAILAECNESMGVENGRFFGGGGGRLEILDGFGSVMVEPWLAAHADPSRYILCRLPDARAVSTLIYSSLYSYSCTWRRVKKLKVERELCSELVKNKEHFSKHSAEVFDPIQSAMFANRGCMNSAICKSMLIPRERANNAAFTSGQSRKRTTKMQLHVMLLLGILSSHFEPELLQIEAPEIRRRKQRHCAI